jgi:hypothetical protein
MRRATLADPTFRADALASVASALKKRSGNATHAAADLGMSIRTMRRVLAEHPSLKKLAARERER